MPNKPTTLAEYRANLTREQREVVDAMREAIAATVPRAEPVFSYNMPGFKLDGEPLAWVAAWKQHFSMYPLTKTMVEAHREALEAFEIAKGTVRFPADEAVPLALIRKLVRTRAAEIRARSSSDRAKAGGAR